MFNIKKMLLGRLMNSRILIIIVLSVLSACQQQVSHRLEQLEIIDIINMDNPIQVNILDIVDSIKYIPLETSEECLLGDIERIKKEGEFYFVHHSRGLYVFDKLGAFLNEIGHRGIAPGEYTSMDCFYVDDKKKTVNIVCNARRQILQYTYDGTYLSSLKIEAKDANIQFALAYDDQIIAHFPLPNDVFQNDREYCIFGKEGNDLVANSTLKAKKLTSKNVHYPFLFYPMALFEGRYLFLSTLSNELYTYDGEEIIPIYAIDFPENCPSTTFLEDHKDLDFFKLRELMNEQKIGLGITALEESSGYLFASINNAATLIWDSNRAVLLSRIHDQDLNIYSDLILPGGVSNEHIGFYPADFLCGKVKDVITESRNESLKKIVNSISEDDNPVIYQYVFKKNMIKSLSEKYKLLNERE